MSKKLNENKILLEEKTKMKRKGERRSKLNEQIQKATELNKILKTNIEQMLKDKTHEDSEIKNSPFQSNINILT